MIYKYIYIYIYGVFAKCWFPKAVEIRILLGARLLANSFLTCPRFSFLTQGGLIASAFSVKLCLVWLPVLIFWSWRRLRERSETGQKHQKGSTCLASIHPSTSSLIIATSTITITTSTTTTSTSTSTSTSSTSTSISSTSNHFTLTTITNSVSRLAARAAFFWSWRGYRERSETGQKQVRNTKKAALA